MNGPCRPRRLPHRFRRPRRWHIEGVSGDTLLGGAIPWSSLTVPPALGATMQGGGGGSGPTFEYYALDALGSVRVVFDAAGAVKARADYEPFGAPIATSTTGPLPREQFTGQQRDGEVGLDYFGARFYHATHGRMLSVDPLSLGAVASPQRWNRYAYALNTPTTVVDPDGRQPCEQKVQQHTGAGSPGNPCARVPDFTVSVVQVDTYSQICVPSAGAGSQGLIGSIVSFFFPTVSAPGVGSVSAPGAYIPPPAVDPDGINGPESAPNVNLEPDALDMLATVAIPGSVGKGLADKGRKLVADTAARGAHSVFKTDLAGRVVKYETFRPQTNPRSPIAWESVLRFDLLGPPHFNKYLQKYLPTPHIPDRTAPDGVRLPLPSEIPGGKK